MKTPDILITSIVPEKGKRIDDFNKHSIYLVKVTAPIDLAEKLFEYANNFFEAAHVITEFILYSGHRDIGKLDTYFFAIAFLYRHCMELGLKAIGFQYIESKAERIKFVKNTRHNLYEVLYAVKETSGSVRPANELEWMERYFQDLSLTDRESDSFRYPFHIVWNTDEWGIKGEFSLKRVFEKQTHIDLLKFANKFEAAHEILTKWYLKEAESASEWIDLKPIFIEEGAIIMPNQSSDINTKDGIFILIQERI